MDPRRFAEMRSYVGLTVGDEAVLRRLRPIAEPHFRTIADEFYALVRSHDGAFANLEDEAQAQRLRESLKGWLGELLSGPRDDAYLERHGRMGRAHVRVGLEMRYVIAAMARIRTALQQVAAAAFGADAATGAAAGLAIARVCDLDLAIMLESYANDLVSRIERARAEESQTIEGAADGRHKRFGDALQVAGVAVLGVDDNGRLIVANRKAERLTGYAFDELAAGDFFAMLFGDRGGTIRARWLEASKDQGVEMEADLRTRSGKVRTMRWHATVDSGMGGLRSIVIVGVDLTHERELERVARRNERLAAAGALAAGLAHEIRNPLNGANLHLSVLDRALARSRDVTPAAREATDVLRAEIKRLSALVTDFLEVARPSPLTLVDADANEIARSVTTMLAADARAQKKRLAFEPLPWPATARLDVQRIERALVNLVRNGLDAVAEGGRVAIVVRRLARHLEIEVADDGVGVPDVAAPIFDAFYTTKERGTGLGLSIVQRVAADHGGEVHFESRPGSTVFTIRLPAPPVGSSDGKPSGVAH